MLRILPKNSLVIPWDRETVGHGVRDPGSMPAGSGWLLRGVRLYDVPILPMDDPGAELARLAVEPLEGAALDRLRELCAAGDDWAAQDQYRAAQLLGVSEARGDVVRAYELALSAMGRHRPARRRAAELYDRLRILDQRPQKFGSQHGPDGSPWPVDPATTDSERAKWDLPPLADLPAANGGGEQP